MCNNLNHYQELTQKLANNPGNSVLENMLNKERTRIYNEIKTFVEKQCIKKGLQVVTYMVDKYFNLALETNLLNAKRTFKKSVIIY